MQPLSQQGNRLWIDSLVLGVVGLALIVFLHASDWLPGLLGVPASPGALAGEEVGLVAAFVAVSFIYLVIRSLLGRTPAGPVETPVAQEARALSILTEDFLHKLGGPEAAQAFLKTCLDQAQAVTGATGSAVHLVEGDELVYTYAGGVPPPNAGKEPLARAIAGEAVRSKKAVLVADAPKDPRFAGALPGQMPFASLLIVPIPFGERVLGTLRVIHAQPNRFSEAAGDYLRPIAILMGAAIWRAGDVDERSTLMRERSEAVMRADQFERRFDALAERLDRGLIMTDAGRERVLMANERAASLLGKPLDTILSHPRAMLEVVVPEDRARVEQLIGQQGLSGGALDYSVARAGSAAFLHEERVPIKDARGNVTGILSILSDHTTSRRIDKEFETVQRRLGVPLEDAPLVFYALRPSGDHGMTFVSPNVEKVLGHRVGDFLTDPVFWTAQLHPDEQAQVFGEFPTLFQKGRLNHSYRFRHADGSYRILEDVMILVRTPDGTPVEIVGYWMDITERVRLQEGVDYSLNRIQELQDSRTRLLNTISHDLANPITPIRLQLSLLEPILKDTPQARNIALMVRNVETLNRLIQDLKDVARLEAGKLRVDPEPREIMATLQSAVDSTQGTAIEKGITLEPKLGKPVTLPFDEQRITQVMLNFLSNALKFTPQGGLITVHALQDKGDVVVRVTDSGRGLSEEEMNRLFKPFSQVHERAEIKEKGTGLGLYICKGLIESHGGRVFVESQGRGKGSTFGFALPIAGAPPKGMGESEEQAPPPPRARSSATAPKKRSRPAKATTRSRSKGAKISGK